MLRRLFVLSLILSLSALALSSCFQPAAPKAEFVEYKISNVTLEGIEAHFFFNISNTNPLPIDVSWYSYKVYINDREFLSEKQGGFNIPANGKKLISIPVTLRYEQVFGTALSVLELIAGGKDSISYRIEGSINAGTMGITVSTPIKASGTIPLPKEVTL